jgi:hypothetical protein
MSSGRSAPGLEHIEFSYVYLDATQLHMRNLASQAVSMAVGVATQAELDEPPLPAVNLGLR